MIKFIYTKNTGIINITVNTDNIDDIWVIKADGTPGFVKPIGYVLSTNHEKEVSLAETITGEVDSTFQMNTLFPYPLNSDYLALDVIYNDGTTNQIVDGNHTYIKLSEGQTIPSKFERETQQINYEVVWFASSDERLKTEITKIDNLNGVNIYSFKYENDKTNTVYLGVLAQELVGNHDYALKTDSNGFYQVNYSALGLKMITMEQYKKNNLSILK